MALGLGIFAPKKGGLKTSDGKLLLRHEIHQSQDVSPIE